MISSSTASEHELGRSSDHQGADIQCCFKRGIEIVLCSAALLWQKRGSANDLGEKVCDGDLVTAKSLFDRPAISIPSNLLFYLLPDGLVRRGRGRMAAAQR